LSAAGSGVFLRGSHSNTAVTVLFSATFYMDEPKPGSVVDAGFLRAGRPRLSSLIEAATMSHTFAAKKLTASFREYPDYLERGGVYGKTDWIVWILPSKLGHGKNAGG
jgi:hypothetical protein